MNDRKVGLLAGVATVAAAVAQFVPSVLVGRYVRESAAPGTVGETGTVLLMGARTVGPLVTLLLALGLGYYLGREVDVAAESRRLVGVLAFGSLPAVFLVSVAAVAFGDGGFYNSRLLYLLGGLLNGTLMFTAPVVVGGYAAAAFRTFEEVRDRPSRAAEGAGRVRAHDGASGDGREAGGPGTAVDGGREQPVEDRREQPVEDRRETTTEESRETAAEDAD